MARFFSHLQRSFTRFGYSVRSLISANSNDEMPSEQRSSRGQQSSSLTTDSYYQYELVSNILNLPRSTGHLCMITCPSNKLIFSATPITFAHFSAFLPIHTSDDPNFPVFGVSWFDAVLFCNQLSSYMNLPPYYHIVNQELVRCDQTSKGFRLPSEQEWEYIATSNNAYTMNDFHERLDDYAWFDSNTKRCMPVAQKKPTPWGAFDLCGLVWEWCDNDYFNPQEINLNSKSRAMRGGSWIDSQFACYVHARQFDSPEARSPYVGFRVIRSV